MEGQILTVIGGLIARAGKGSVAIKDVNELFESGSRAGL